MKRIVSTFVVCILAVLCMGTTSETSNLEDLFGEFGRAAPSNIIYYSVNAYVSAFERLENVAWTDGLKGVFARYPVMADRYMQSFEWATGSNEYTWSELFGEVLECSSVIDWQLGRDLSALYWRVGELEIEVAALRSEVAGLKAAGSTTQYQSPSASGSSSEYVDDVADWAEDEFQGVYDILNELESRIYKIEQALWRAGF